MSHVWRVAPLALLLLAGPAAAEWSPDSQDDTVLESLNLEPSNAPTWADDVRLEISGISGCLIAVQEVAVEEDPTPTVRVELSRSCIVDPPTPRRFKVTAQIGHLDPATYRLLIVNDPAVMESEFTVFHQAEVAIDWPEVPFNDVEPVAVNLRMYADNRLRVETPTQPAPGILEILVDRLGAASERTSPLAAQVLEVDLGTLPAGDYEIHVIDVTREDLPAAATRDLTVYDKAGCLPYRNRLCLGEARFQVTTEWRDFEGRPGRGVGVPLADREDTGAFWFFDDENLELTVKVLDGCGVNGHYWVFIASGSTVEYEVTVTDTETGEPRTYRNELGQTPSLIPDTTALGCP